MRAAYEARQLPAPHWPGSRPVWGVVRPDGGWLIDPSTGRPEWLVSASLAAGYALQQNRDRGLALADGKSPDPPM